jgi:hypothetical protein
MRHDNGLGLHLLGSFIGGEQQIAAAALAKVQVRGLGERRLGPGWHSNMAFPANAVSHHCNTIAPVPYQTQVVRQNGRRHLFLQLADDSLLLLDRSISRPEKFLNPKHMFDDGFHE